MFGSLWGIGAVNLTTAPLTPETPQEINIDISGLLKIADKSLYAQQIQLILTTVLLGLIVVLIMIGGAKK